MIDDAFGGFADDHRDGLYLLRDGFIFTSPSVYTSRTLLLYSGALLMAVDRSPLRLDLAGQTESLAAVAIAPRVSHRLDARRAPLVSVHIEPRHALYPQFCALPGKGVRDMPRKAFEHFDGRLAECFARRLSLYDAQELFDELLSEAAAQLPPAARRDVRIEQTLQALDSDPHSSLQALARSLGLSYDRMSHLFSAEVGLPLKSYQLWRKVKLAALRFSSGESLTKIAHSAGFADSAHLSRTFNRFFDIKPSYLVNSDCVQVFN